MSVVEVKFAGKVLFRGDVDSPKVEVKDGTVQVSASTPAQASSKKKGGK